MKNFFIILGLIFAFIAGYFVSQRYDFKIETKNKKDVINLKVEPTDKEKNWLAMIKMSMVVLVQLDIPGVN